MAEKVCFNTQISGRVRLAIESDVPHLHKLMYQMAKYHNYTKVFNATEASISTNLFNSNNPCPPFYSVTTFILEVSPDTFPQKPTKNSIFDPILKTINLDSPILDPELELFNTDEHNNVFVAGYVLFFPSYSGYFEKPGFFIENMYVRECYRKYGFGKMLFSAVASQAVKMGFTKVDWLTVGWNNNAIDFYLGMGAYIMGDVKRFRLSGEGLDAFATSDRGC
ncbi:GCN5-related N-acetyltransferase 8-like [Lycium ferocissimum]|uniref:GCN5-related N-acetyltransferase 8-like n=1 Tax=Lycium ferocissimum TaxID=112874 RepID=UPI0028158392|nr:GCN5-related N-acetyltransferase 8-like [Lycium ferocissimum]